MEDDKWMIRRQVTILKYSYLKEGKRVYAFKVMDKFNIEDEVERLDAMILESQILANKLPGYKQLWIKNSVII